MDYTKISKESYKTQAKFAQTKKQLFQAKRKIDDLEEEIEDLQKELDDEKLKKKGGGTESDEDIFTLNEDNIETIELQTEIATLKAQIASKDIVIDELNMDNDKWQEAHDSIFQRMTEAQTRLAKEINEFEDAKKFYENKLSILRDKLQDNTITFWSYEQRINQITKLYETDTDKKVPEWKDKPNVNYDTDENKAGSHRISIQLAGNSSNNASGKKMAGRNSISNMSGGWDNFSPMPSFTDVNNVNYTHTPNDSILFDGDEDEDDEDEDHNGAFGAFGDIDTPKVSNNSDEFGCEEDDDGANAFGAF